MIQKADMPKREAIVTWSGRPSLSFDPIMLPVEVSAHGLLADVFDLGLLRLIDSMGSYSEDLSLVWSDGESDVMGCCPACDKVFPVATGRWDTVIDAVVCKHV